MRFAMSDAIGTSSICSNIIIRAVCAGLHQIKFYKAVVRAADRRSFLDMRFGRLHRDCLRLLCFFNVI